MEFLNNIKKSWKYLEGNKNKLIKYFICNVLTIVVSIIVPLIYAKTIIYLTNNELIQLLLTVLLIFFIEIFRNILSYFWHVYSMIIYRESFTQIQIDLGRNILKLTNSTIDKNSSGVFIQRLTNDTSQIADVFSALNSFLSEILSDIGIFVAVFFLNKIVFIYLIFSTIVLYFVNSYRVKILNENDKVTREKQEKVTGFVGELVRGLRDIKMLNAEKSFMVELSNKITDLNKQRYKMQKVNSGCNMLINSCRDIFDLLLYLLLICLLYKAKLSISVALIIVNYSKGLDSIALSLGRLLEYVKYYNLSSKRIFDILNSEEFPKESFGSLSIEKVNGDFEFKNVKFSYHDKAVLKGINFKVKANETVAFVGKSGAGKTTIFNLLCKMYEPNSGKITIDGIDITKLDRETIRGNITIISQDPYIFNLSIKENLKLVKNDLTDDEMIEACRLACLDEYIESLPEKYDTIIGEGGVNLSGGQKQRLAIARALVQKTEIILFDEATSALDNETQNKIQKAIENMKSEYTILIIAHRLSTIVGADRILFLNEGKIEAEGTHRELIKKCPTYKKLYETEIKK